eukprot:TRINITY_DN570_c0_g1_i2.p1 TRINITY_DN570_c0_g1~~TRINITY_DN570_c0_g1_i2.p1  ORF type:complete len:174 (+),score=27.26 TRINITY_DN570_c0_g1_i2:133-654(+)
MKRSLPLDERSTLHPTLFEAPDFHSSMVSTQDHSISTFTLSSLKGFSVYLIFYTGDFCSPDTEALKEWVKVDLPHVKLILVSRDSRFCHLAWLKKEGLLDRSSNIALIEDLNGDIARCYKHQYGTNCWSMFYINPTMHVEEHYHFSRPPLAQDIRWHYRQRDEWMAKGDKDSW